MWRVIAILETVDGRRIIIYAPKVSSDPERPFLVTCNGENGFIRHVVKRSIVVDQVETLQRTVEFHQSFVRSHDELVVGIFDDGFDVEYMIYIMCGFL